MNPSKSLHDYRSEKKATQLHMQKYISIKYVIKLYNISYLS